MSPLSLYLVDCETGCSILFSHLNVTIDTGTAFTLILSCPLSKVIEESSVLMAGRVGF